MSGLPPQGFLKRREADAIVAATRRNAMQLAGAGNRVSTFANGTIATTPRQQPWRWKPNVPFRLVGFVDTGPTSKIIVRPGMVNNLVPTIGGTSIAAMPPPALTVSGSTGVVYLKATVDAAGTITALVIQNGTSVPADTTTAPIYKYKLIGSWTASGGAFTSVMGILNTNQTFRLCNGAAEWY